MGGGIDLSYSEGLEAFKTTTRVIRVHVLHEGEWVVNPQTSSFRAYSISRCDSDAMSVPLPQEK